jgi:hypothetical protein
MGHRQKGKGNKRRKSWHRGRGEARRWDRAMRRWRRVDTTAPPASGPDLSPVARHDPGHGEPAARDSRRAGGVDLEAADGRRRGGHVGAGAGSSGSRLANGEERGSRGGPAGGGGYRSNDAGEPSPRVDPRASTRLQDRP